MSFIAVHSNGERFKNMLSCRNELIALSCLGNFVYILFVVYFSAACAYTRGRFVSSAALPLQQTFHTTPRDNAVRHSAFTICDVLISMAEAFSTSGTIIPVLGDCEGGTKTTSTKLHTSQCRSTRPSGGKSPSENGAPFSGIHEFGVLEFFPLVLGCLPTAHSHSPVASNFKTFIIKLQSTFSRHPLRQTFKGNFRWRVEKDSRERAKTYPLKGTLGHVER